MLPLKHFRLASLLLCFGLSLALNLWPALGQAQDRAALQALYQATNGAEWTTNTNWDTTAALNTWHGVTTNAEGRVVALNLRANNLSGSIPSDIGNLSALTRLDLSSNRLNGEIQAALGRLSNLTHLDLSANLLSGEIPAALGNLSNLSRLSLDTNVLSGMLPNDLSRLGLTTLEMDTATGLYRSAQLETWLTNLGIALPSCPSDSAVCDNPGDRVALMALYRATNGPRWTTRTNWDTTQALGTWHGVTTNAAGQVVALDLSDNNLSGPISPDIDDLIDNLTALEVLDLGGNRLNGTIPTMLDSWGSNLTHLDLSNNALSGSIPQVNSLIALVHLDLSGNNLIGSIPPVDSLADLQVLDLSANNLTGLILPVDSLAALTHLDLGDNRLSGPIPDLISLSGLLYLDLSNNALNGSIPDLLLDDSTPALLALTHLDLSENDLSGSVPDISVALPLLQFLDLSHNRFRGLLHLSSPLCAALLNLTHFDLSHNQLTGPIPASLGRLEDLTHLDLSHNQLSGPLPGELGGMFVFRCRNAAGDWVDEERQLDDLTWLDLSHNQLTGPIPSALGGLSDLTSLDLSHNQLSGPIHPDLGNLNLSVLRLDSDTGLCWTAALEEWLSQLGVTLPSCGAGGTDGGGAGDDGDRAVLQALYRATNGDEWEDPDGMPMNMNWNTPAHLNTWYGVTTNNAGRVTALHLDNNNLSGFIPSALGGLTDLQILDLSTNNLSGLIPPALGNLPNLRVLRLDGNLLRGALPAALGRLRNLGALTLDADTGLCQTAALAQWLRRLGITLPLCRAEGTTPGTVTPLLLTPESPTTSVPGQLMSADEVNYFRLDIPYPGILSVETTGDTDTFGSLTEEGTRAVTTDEDSGEDNNFRIAQPAIEATYFVTVSGGGDTGEYTLVVRYIPGVLENPQLGSFQSGIGVISGWVCEADQVVIEFERPGGRVWRESASYGTSRTDTVEAGRCEYPDSGFGLLWNWNKLGPGKHTVRAMVDGVVLAEHTLIVTTLGLGEFPRGLRGDYQLEDFPSSGDTTRLLWQEAQQNFVIAAETGGGGGSHQNPGQATLGNPSPGSFQSGIGVISGWVCEADQIDIVLNPGTATEETWRAGYGTSRTDTSGKCGDSANGFGLLYNWNKLGPGQHTIRALADGFEFARSTFTVTTLGVEFARGLYGEYELEDFPEVGTTVTVKWQEALQNFTITAVE